MKKKKKTLFHIFLLHFFYYINWFVLASLLQHNPSVIWPTTLTTIALEEMYSFRLGNDKNKKMAKVKKESFLALYLQGRFINDLNA